MRTAEYFAACPVFSLDAATQILKPPGGRSGAVERLKHHLESQHLKLVARGVYAVVPAGIPAERFQPDPFLVAAAARPDAVFSHHSALELLGAAHSVWREYTLYTRPRRRPLSLLGTRMLAVFGMQSQKSAEDAVRAAIENYNRAMLEKNLPALKEMLASDIVLYEHSVRNIGLDDVWDNHLRPEVEAFENAKMEFTDVRVWTSTDLALVTRQYSIQATMKGKPIDARGNETMGWVRRDGKWKVNHIHYSHPCPRSKE